MAGGMGVDRWGPRTPLEGLQRPQTPAVTRCLRQLYDVSLHWSLFFNHRSTPLAGGGVGRGGGGGGGAGGGGGGGGVKGVGEP